MSRYVQRYPFSPKAEWWKRYTDTSQIGKRKIYVAEPNIAFEVSGFPQQLIQLTTVPTDPVEEIQIGEIIDDIPVSALRFQRKLYTYDPIEQDLVEQDLVEEETTIIDVDTTMTIKFEKNTYILKQKFDCIKETDKESSDYQPLQGLPIDSSYVTIKTHNFNGKLDKPSHGDIIKYTHQFWFIEEVRESSYFTPKEQKVLHLTLKAINK